MSCAHVIPNIAHEVYLFQKFGIANKESILERLSRDMRKWAEIEMQIEARYYHGQVPWYNSPCGLISQLVWKVRKNHKMPLFQKYLPPSTVQNMYCFIEG